VRESAQSWRELLIDVKRRGLASAPDLAVGDGARRGRPHRAQVLAAKAHPLKGQKAAPKYRGPNGETWAGRGLAPRWLTALEKKGKKRESFFIAT
jgi:DNA-binding protein H-NS